MKIVFKCHTVDEVEFSQLQYHLTDLEKLRFNNSELCPKCYISKNFFKNKKIKAKWEYVLNACIKYPNTIPYNDI